MRIYRKAIIGVLVIMLVSCIPMRGQAGDMRELSKGTAAKVSGGTITSDDAQRMMFPENFDPSLISFSEFTELSIYPFKINSWKMGQDCLDIEYKGRHYFVGDGCVKEVRP